MRITRTQTRTHVRNQSRQLFDAAMEVFGQHVSFSRKVLYDCEMQTSIGNLRLSTRRTHKSTSYALYACRKARIATRHLRKVLENRVQLASQNPKLDLLKDILTRLLDRGADPTISVQGTNVYSVAASYGYVEIVKRLAEVGILDCQKDRDMCFLASIMSGKMELIHYLLEKGANPHTIDPSSGRNCLYHAAAHTYSYDGVLSYLIESLGVDINVQDTQGVTPLEYTIGVQKPNLTHILINHGAKINTERPSSNPAITLATHFGYSDILFKLLDCGADINVPNSLGYTSLVLAVRKNNMAILHTLLERGADPNNICNNKTALVFAAQHGHLDAAMALLNSGALLDQRVGDDNVTALVYAVMNNHQDVVSALLLRGADPNIYIQDQTLLYAAIQSDFGAITGLLLEHGADVNAYSLVKFTKSSEYITPLITAIHFDHYGIVQILIHHGADIDLPSKDKKMSPLTSAIQTRNRPIFDLLLQHGADVDSKCLEGPYCPLQSAISVNLPEVVELLLARGAQVNYSAHSKPLTLAARVGSRDIVEILLRRGVDINPTTDPQGGTPLRAAIKGGHNHVVEFLLEKGANVNDRRGDVSVLQFCVQHGSLEIIEMVLDHGANINETTVYGDNMLMTSIHLNREEFAELFVYRGINVNYRCPGIAEIYNTALACAIRRNAHRLVPLLASHGADLNLTNDNGYTALMLAVYSHESPCVAALLQQGADPNIQHPDSGRMALSLTVRRKNVEFITMLLQHGANPNLQLSRGHTSLMLAIQDNYKQGAEILVKKTDLTIRITTSHETALLFAIHLDRPLMVELLLDNGDDPNTRYTDRDKHTALMLAVCLNRPHLVKILLRAEVLNPNLQCANGNTALMLAASRGFRECVVLLLEKTDVSLKNHQGQTVLDVAAIGLVDLYLKMAPKNK